MKNHLAKGFQLKLGTPRREEAHCSSHRFEVADRKYSGRDGRQQTPGHFSDAQCSHKNTRLSQASQQSEIIDRCRCHFGLRLRHFYRQQPDATSARPVIHSILKTVERENRGFGGHPAPEFGSTGENLSPGSKRPKKGDMVKGATPFCGMFFFLS